MKLNNPTWFNFVRASNQLGREFRTGIERGWDLQDLQENEVNILVKCYNRFPFLKIAWLLEHLKVRDRESGKTFNKNVYLVNFPLLPW